MQRKCINKKHYSLLSASPLPNLVGESLPFWRGGDGVQRKLTPTIFNRISVILFKSPCFLKLLLKVNPPKNGRFWRPGRKIIMLTPIIMLTWVSGYIFIYTYISNTHNIHKITHLHIHIYIL